MMPFAIDIIDIYLLAWTWDKRDDPSVCYPEGSVDPFMSVMIAV